MRDFPDAHGHPGLLQLPAAYQASGFPAGSALALVARCPSFSSCLSEDLWGPTAASSSEIAGQHFCRQEGALQSTAAAASCSFQVQHNVAFEASLDDDNVDQHIPNNP